METVALVQAIKEQVHESNQPNHGQKEIDLLLDNIAVYLKRAKGISLNDNDYKIQPHMYLDGLIGVPSQRISDSLVRRLRVNSLHAPYAVDEVRECSNVAAASEISSKVGLRFGNRLSIIYIV